MPTAVICYLKNKAHDLSNYYNSRFLILRGTETYENHCNVIKHIDMYKQYKNKYGGKDFLGRSTLIILIN